MSNKDREILEKVFKTTVEERSPGVYIVGEFNISPEISPDFLDHFEKFKDEEAKG